jgi:threonine/homoserine/homoserine lactone efflux protein
VDNVFPAGAAGILCGFVASVGVGPVNLTVVEQGLRRGFRGGLLAGLGAITAETIYAALALTGQASILPGNPSVHLVIRLAAIGVVVILGLRYLLIRPSEDRIERLAREVERKWEQYHKSWLLGFLVTISNLTLLIVWVTLSAMLFAHGWVHPVLSSRLTCMLGVFAGGLLWYVAVASFVARAHRRLPMRALVTIQRITGVIFLGFAALLAWRMFLA